MANTAVLTRSPQHSYTSKALFSPVLLWGGQREEKFSCEFSADLPVRPPHPSPAALAASQVRAGVSGCVPVLLFLLGSQLHACSFVFFLLLYFFKSLECFFFFFKRTSCSQEGFDLGNLFIYPSVCCVKMPERAFIVAWDFFGFCFPFSA